MEDGLFFSRDIGDESGFVIRSKRDFLDLEWPGNGVIGGQAVSIEAEHEEADRENVGLVFNEAHPAP